VSSAAAIVVAVKGSLALTVFAGGLHSKAGDATYLRRHRPLFARSIISMNVVIPVLALGLVIALHLRPPVQLALVALALSPVPAALSIEAARVRREDSYMIGLLVGASTVALVLVPATMWLLGIALGGAFVVSSVLVVRIIGATVIIPLALGFGTRRIAPRAAARSAPPLSALARVVLIVALLPVLGTSWPALRSMIGNGTLAAIVVITGVGLFTGHRLGGPVRDDRTVLALATALRHPGIAIAIASTVFPDQKVVAAVVLLTLFVGGIASAPYATWSKQMFYAGDDAVSRSRRPARPVAYSTPAIRLGSSPERRK